ncbi:hypothetical protein C1Y63_04870 [Corynebacterium sp. 13CS0277]|uniref:hypothetical protein n=1 Tax=Corynebacterium sp. 13CS0277 TaxID=2071994 RepID=UPI000D04048C|nr:hypothetical protein [Corynebacterium sp. 13CS0277]PRQ11744.1 hypothetical protein C1Y63_04870 [Corynebacterium sp. 13CS0277]
MSGLTRDGYGWHLACTDSEHLTGEKYTVHVTATQLGTVGVALAVPSASGSVRTCQAVLSTTEVPALIRALQEACQVSVEAEDAP